MNSLFYKIFNRKVKEESKKNIPSVDELLEEYGKIENVNPKYNLRIMFIADTHDSLGWHNEIQEEIKKEDGNYDICILLGDHSLNDLKIIKDIVPNNKLFGIVGNHDSWKLLEEAGIKDINKTIISVNGVKIAAIAGSTRYKDGKYGMYTQEESMEIAEKLEVANVLISHDRPYIRDTGDHVHDGLKGITYYLYKNHVPIHVHGHLHENSEEILKNGTKSICIYGYKIIDL